MFRSVFAAAALLSMAIRITAAGVVVLPAHRTPRPESPPRMTGPRVFGVRPGAPFLFRVSATGDRPLTFAAVHLPTGLKLNARTGQMTGSLYERGIYTVTLVASNHNGTVKRPLRVVVGDKISLTPPLGWNSWNVWGSAVTEGKVRAAADALVSSGLADHGFSYVNIDDGWSGPRTAGVPPGPLQGDPHKFPAMKALADYVHARGLKFGLYSTPRAETYAKFPGGSVETAQGSVLCSAQDIRQFAEWGVDYLKYDGDDEDAPENIKTAGFARACGRDMVVSLSHWGGGELRNAPTYARLYQSWRTAYDISDGWNPLFEIAFSTKWGQAQWAPYSGPGRWNDADMLVIGTLGLGGTLHPSALTPDEQYTHVSLWSLLASPLLLGCDLTQLDPFTLSLVTNDEVLDVDQDPLGLQAKRISMQGATPDSAQVWARELEDGSRAVGLFNPGDSPTDVAVIWSHLGIEGKQSVRDLWRQRDIGVFQGTYTARVPRHGVVLVKLTPARVGAPALKEQPLNIDGVQGHEATVKVVATGAAPLHYQWTRNGSVLPGAELPRLTLAALGTADDGASLRCIVSNPIGHVTSYEAILTVRNAAMPSRSIHPSIPQTITVDVRARHQRIQGFGTSIIGWEPRFVSLFRKPSFQKLYVDEVGCSLLRVQLPPEVSPTPIPRWQDIRYKDFVLGSPEDQNQAYLNFAQAITRMKPGSITVIGSVWSPPAWMKENHSVTDPLASTRANGVRVNNRLKPEYYKHFARWLVEWIKLYRSRGVRLAAVSLQNEPYFTQPFGSCVYTPQEYASVLKVVAETLKEEGLNQTLLFGPEHMTFDTWGNGKILEALKQSDALPYLNVFASHGYTDGIAADVSKNSSAALWRTIAPYGLPYWVTEGGTGGHEWPAPLDGIGAMLHNALVHGHASAVVPWQITDMEPTEHPLMVMQTQTKKTQVAKQYFRFIRPGALRVEATPSDGPVAASAFFHPVSHTLTIVLINREKTPQAVALRLVAAPGFGTMKAYRTSALDSFRQIGGPRISGDTVTLTLPAQSVVTLVRS